MNIKGIEFLRELGLPGPFGEVITEDPDSIDLDILYNKVDTATLLAFDKKEPIDQNQLFEKNVRNYYVRREEFYEEIDILRRKMSDKGVKDENIIFLAHQTYEDISKKDNRFDVHRIEYSGRVSLECDSDGFGEISIDIKKGLREADSDFDRDLDYHCPVKGGRVMKSKEKTVEGNLRDGDVREYLNKIIEDVYRIPGNPHLDFEVTEEGYLFYHDLFLGL